MQRLTVMQHCSTLMYTVTYKQLADTNKYCRHRALSNAVADVGLKSEKSDFGSSLHCHSPRFRLACSSIVHITYAVYAVNSGQPALTLWGTAKCCRKSG